MGVIYIKIFNLKNKLLFKEQKSLILLVFLFFFFWHSFCLILVIGMLNLYYLFKLFQGEILNQRVEKESAF